MSKYTPAEEAVFNVLNDWLDLAEPTFDLMMSDLRVAGAFGPSEEEFEYGTRVVLPAFPPHPESIKEYLAGSRENAEADRDAVLSVTKLREVYLIRRQVAGPWEVVE